MKILAVCTRFPLASETFVRDTIAGIASRGHDVHVLALNGGDDDAFDDRDRALGIPDRVIRPPAVGSFAMRLLTAPLRFVALLFRAPLVALRSIDPRLGWRAHSLQLLGWADAIGRRDDDVVLAHFGPAGEIAELLRAIGILDAPIATEFHGYDITRETHPEIRYARLFAHGDALLPVSDALRRRLIAAGAPEDRTIIQRLGIDVDRFAFAERDPGENLRILSVGRIVEKKGFEDGVRAVAGLIRTGINVSYRIAGDGPLAEDVRRTAEELGIAESVEILGWCERDDIAREMATADVFLAPSVTAADGDMEGLPVVIMEALATGLCVVGTRHSGIPEAVEHEVNGMLADEHDIEALTAGLLALSDHEKRRAASRAARQSALDTFDSRRVLDSLEAHLERIARR